MEPIGSRLKYSLLEIERRWLVDLDSVGDLSQLTFRTIEDLYVDGTRLRLRKILAPDGGETFKLAKKYGRAGRRSEALTNLYLTKVEYELLNDLPGRRVTKRRYAVEAGAMDVYIDPNPGLAIFEMEFQDEVKAAHYQPPPFVTREITGDEVLSGASLSTDRQLQANRSR